MSGIFLLSLIVILLGLWCLVSFLINIKRGKDSLTWPSVFGKITKADIEFELDGASAKTWKPTVRYTYFVNGKEYNSSRVAFGFIPGIAWGFDDGHLRAATIANTYAKQYTTPVFYSPTNPAQSVLETGAHSENKNLFLMGLFLVLVGLGLRLLG
jgi:hypothetical protein